MITAIIKPGREKPLLRRHPWVFSGAVKRISGEPETGETVEILQDKYEAFVAARGSHQLPTAFARLAVDINAFLDTFASNHILAVDGTYIEELIHLCRLFDIEPVVYR